MKICNFKNVYIKDAATVVGKLEGEGPLGSLFDMCESDSYFGKDSWEEAEAEMCGRAVGILLGKTGTDDSNVELMLGGDLLNQCTATGFTAADFPIPYLGLYGACSTAAEGMLIGGAFVSGGFADNAITLASSHFCSSERQFRYPLEYGSLRTPTAQNTVTGAGAFMLTNEKCDIRLSRALAGKVNINGITDANNMGAAMATAAESSFPQSTGRRSGGSSGRVRRRSGTRRASCPCGAGALCTGWGPRPSARRSSRGTTRGRS